MMVGPPCLAPWDFHSPAAVPLLNCTHRGNSCPAQAGLGSVYPQTGGTKESPQTAVPAALVQMGLMGRTRGKSSKGWQEWRG